MNELLHRLRANDRVLLVGDTRQHQAVEAGRPYQQLQEAGIQTARLDEIVRQKDPALKEVVEKLSRGQVRQAMEKLDSGGRVHEIADRDERIAVIAHEYAKQPKGTLVVFPRQPVADGDQPSDPLRHAGYGPDAVPRTPNEGAGRPAGDHWCGSPVGHPIRTRQRGAVHKGQQDTRHCTRRVRASRKR